MRKRVYNRKVEIFEKSSYKGKERAVVETDTGR